MLKKGKVEVTALSLILLLAIISPISETHLYAQEAKTLPIVIDIRPLLVFDAPSFLDVEQKIPILFAVARRDMRSLLPCTRIVAEIWYKDLPLYRKEIAPTLLTSDRIYFAELSNIPIPGNYKLKIRAYYKFLGAEFPVTAEKNITIGFFRNITSRGSVLIDFFRFLASDTFDVSSLIANTTQTLKNSTEGFSDILRVADLMRKQTYLDYVHYPLRIFVVSVGSYSQELRDYVIRKLKYIETYISPEIIEEITNITDSAQLYSNITEQRGAVFIFPSYTSVFPLGSDIEKDFYRFTGSKNIWMSFVNPSEMSESQEQLWDMLFEHYDLSTEILSGYFAPKYTDLAKETIARFDLNESDTFSFKGTVVKIRGNTESVLDPISVWHEYMISFLLKGKTNIIFVRTTNRTFLVDLLFFLLSASHELLSITRMIESFRNIIPKTNTELREAVKNITDRLMASILNFNFSASRRILIGMRDIIMEFFNTSASAVIVGHTNFLSGFSLNITSVVSGAIDGMISWVRSEAPEDVVWVIESIRQNITRSVDAMLNTTIHSMVTEINSIAGEILDKLSVLVRYRNVSSIAQIPEEIRNLVSSSLSNIRELLNNITELLKNISETALQVALQYVEDAWETVKGIMDRIVNATVSSIEQLREYIVNMSNELKEKVTSASLDVIFTGMATGAVSGAIMGAMVGSVVPGIGTALGACIGAVVGMLGSVIVLSIGASKVHRLAEWVKEQMNVTLQAVMTKMKEIVMNIRSMLETVVSTVKQQIAMVINIIRSNVETIYDVINTYVGSLLENIRSIVGMLLGQISGTVDTLFSLVDSTAEMVSQLGSDISRSMRSFVSGALLPSFDSIADIMARVKDAIISGNADMASCISSKLISLVSDFQLRDIDRFRGVIDTITRGFRQTRETMSSLGKNLLSFEERFQRMHEGAKEIVEKFQEDIEKITSVLSNIGEYIGSLDEFRETLYNLYRTIDYYTPIMPKSMREYFDTMVENLYDIGRQLLSAKNLGITDELYSGMMKSVSSIFALISSNYGKFVMILDDLYNQTVIYAHGFDVEEKVRVVLLGLRGKLLESIPIDDFEHTVAGGMIARMDTSQLCDKIFGIFVRGLKVTVRGKAETEEPTVSFARQGSKISVSNISSFVGEITILYTKHYSYGSSFVLNIILLPKASLEPMNISIVFILVSPTRSELIREQKMLMLNKTEVNAWTKTYTVLGFAQGQGYIHIEFSYANGTKITEFVAPVYFSWGWFNYILIASILVALAVIVYKLKKRKAFGVQKV